MGEGACVSNQASESMPDQQSAWKAGKWDTTRGPGAGVPT